MELTERRGFTGLTGRKGPRICRVVPGSGRLKIPLGHLGQKGLAGQRVRKRRAGTGMYRVRTRLKGRGDLTGCTGPRSCRGLTGCAGLTGCTGPRGCRGLMGWQGLTGRKGMAGRRYAGLEVPWGLRVPIIRGGRAG